ncbi:hypothetical protein CXF83_01085 [Shewanella sp. Choline-02u-19]|nr:hypothetical protein CXF86_06905 [Shewanella sp. GutCb]PKH60024.1 hypothetical protein CXF84_03160 [Shewanella sp. Bg11-22]PKI30705.1 hypothetical protein CXF83_01085 [Shewanella sp. Choline-02u-19]
MFFIDQTRQILRECSLIKKIVLGDSSVKRLGKSYGFVFAGVVSEDHDGKKREMTTGDLFP